MNAGFGCFHADQRGPWHTCLKRLDGSRCEAKHDRLFCVRQSLFFSVISATTAQQLRAKCGVALGIRVVLDNDAESRGSLFPGSVHTRDR
jgi:hypothetical protein